VALFFCPSHRQNIGGPGPSPGAASGPSGGPGPPAPCSPLPGLCAGLLRCARPCPPPPGFAPPRRPLPLGSASLAAGPALAVRGFGPRPGPPVRSAPLRFVPRSAGLGLSARGLARRSGPPSPPPPRLRRPPFPLVWGGGRGSPRPRGSFALPSARAASCCRPCFAPGAARPPARLRLWRGPPFRPAPAGRLRPRSSAPGGRRRPCGAASWPLRGPPAL
jgi:hypothetical protein